jgi:N-acylneuraminate cytidylyltransferase
MKQGRSTAGEDSHLRTVAIIPARGGSKGIPRKNVIDFCGYPLLAWSIAAARGAKGIDRVFVSTDDREIGAVAREYGAEVIDRPPELSGDAATSESALLHTLDVLKARGENPERVVFLQPTSPLRETEELNAALLAFERDGFDSLFSGARPEDYCLWMQSGSRLTSLNYDYRNRRRRQEMLEEELWIETGSFYITKSALLRSEANRLGGKIGIHEVPIWKSYEIDSLSGLELCALLMRHHGLDRTPPKPARS